jgi:hypothetical protein
MERFITIDDMVLLVDEHIPNKKGDQYVWISHDEKLIVTNNYAIRELENPGRFFSKYKKVNIVWCYIPEKIKGEYLVTLFNDFH